MSRGGYYWAVAITGKYDEAELEAVAEQITRGWIDAVETTDEIVCEGLHLHMDKSYEVKRNGTSDVTATKGDEMLFAKCSENDRGETAEEILASFQDYYLANGYGNVELLERNGMSYLAFVPRPGYTSLRTFYVHGEYVWDVFVSGEYDEAELEAIADQITSGYFE